MPEGEFTTSLGCTVKVVSRMYAWHPGSDVLVLHMEPDGRRIEVLLTDEEKANLRRLLTPPVYPDDMLRTMREGEDPRLDELQAAVRSFLDALVESEEQGDRWSWPIELEGMVGWVHPDPEMRGA